MTTTHCVMTQKSAVLICFVAEACNEAVVTFHFTLRSLWRSHTFVLSTQLVHKHSQTTMTVFVYNLYLVQSDTKKTGTFENPNKN